MTPSSSLVLLSTGGGNGLVLGSCDMVWGVGRRELGENWKGVLGNDEGWLDFKMVVEILVMMMMGSGANVGIPSKLLLKMFG